MTPCTPSGPWTLFLNQRSSSFGLLFWQMYKIESTLSKSESKCTSLSVHDVECFHGVKVKCFIIQLEVMHYLCAVISYVIVKFSFHNNYIYKLIYVFIVTFATFKLKINNFENGLHRSLNRHISTSIKLVVFALHKTKIL